MTVLGIVVLAACGSGASTSTTAKVDPLVKVDYPGRLLLSVPGPWVPGLDRVDHLSELTHSSPDPTDFTGPSADGYVDAVSPDGSLIAYSSGSGTPQVTVVGPGRTEVYEGGGAVPMVFSPDLTRLAHNMGDSVEVSDPATHRFVQLPLPAVCKTYSRGPADSGWTSICGAVGGPVWLDPETLYLTHFVGEMPGSVSCPDNGRCTVPANTASIVSVTGKVVTTTLPAYAPVAARGSTVVLEGSPDQGSFCSWIDVDQLRAGSASVKALPPGTLMHSLSPDGTKVVVAGKPGKPWELVDIRTGAVEELGTRTTAAYWPVSDVPVFWSPDGKFFAVQVDGVLVPNSKAYGSFTPSPGSFGYAIWLVPASAEKGGLVATLAANDATPRDSSASEATILVGWAN